MLIVECTGIRQLITITALFIDWLIQNWNPGTTLDSSVMITERNGLKVQFKSF